MIRKTIWTPEHAYAGHGDVLIEEVHRLKGMSSATSYGRSCQLCLRRFSDGSVAVELRHNNGGRYGTTPVILCGDCVGGIAAALPDSNTTIDQRVKVIKSESKLLAWANGK